MQEMLDGFISKFVLCPGCKNPETDLVGLVAFAQVSLLNYLLGDFQGPGNLDQV